MTMPVDAVASRFADAGSIPAASTFKNAFPDVLEGVFLFGAKVLWIANILQCDNDYYYILQVVGLIHASEQKYFS